MRICVYCSSSDAVDGVYVEAARALGHEIATRGHELVYGGASIGLMGDVARAATAAGGRVLGIIPRRFAQRGLTYQDTDETIITETMAERKSHMIEVAEAFVALPGGFGTLDELFEVMTLVQTGKSRKRPILLFGRDFWQRLLDFDVLIEHGVISPEDVGLFHYAETAEEAWGVIKDAYSGDNPALTARQFKGN